MCQSWTWHAVCPSLHLMPRLRKLWRRPHTGPWREFWVTLRTRYGTYMTHDDRASGLKRGGGYLLCNLPVSCGCMDWILFYCIFLNEMRFILWGKYDDYCNVSNAVMHFCNYGFLHKIWLATCFLLCRWCPLTLLVTPTPPSLMLALASLSMTTSWSSFPGLFTFVLGLSYM